MKILNPVFKTIFLGGCISAVVFSACGEKKGSSSQNKPSSNTSTASNSANSGKIAYVNMDSLETKYTVLKDKKEAFEKKTANMDAEVERLARSFQSEYIAFQKKAQEGTLSQSEGEAAQKRLGQMQQNIDNRRQTMGEQLMKERDEFNKELQETLDSYLEEYNKEKGYDYILTYQKGGFILFANKALDITEEVVKGMNERGPIGKNDKKDTTAKP